MEKEEKDSPKFAKGFYVILGVLGIVSILTILSFTNPELLIGDYLDNDIRIQLIDLHESNIEGIKNGTIPFEDKLTVNAQFTFEDDEIVDMRISRSIDVFNELFSNYQRDHAIYDGDDGIILRLSWIIDEDL